MQLTSQKATAATIELVKATLSANPIAQLGVIRGQQDVANEHVKYVMALYKGIYQELIEAPDMQD